jgi:hypothetical protein
LLVLIDEVIDDSFEFGFQVQGVEGDSEFIRDPSRIGRIARAATALFVVESTLKDRQQWIRLPVPQFASLARFLSVAHKNPGHLVPLLEKQMRSDTRIDPTTHC